MVKPAAKRKLVEHARQGYPISERRACRLFGLGPSTRYYRPHRKRDDGPLRTALSKHATDHQGWGYRGLMDWLVRDGFRDNHKKVYRIYAEEGLQLGRRKRRVKARYRGSKLEEPTDLNERWTMDFVSDQLSDGRVFRMLVVMDVYTRECLALEADTSLGGQRVARVLSRIKEQRGRPKVVGTDNGPEFRSRHMDQWAYENGVKLHFIKPGTPTQNAWVESLNSQIRKRLLNTHWFANLDEVRKLAEKWRKIYNTIQRHGSLNKQTPEQFATQARLWSATPPYVGPEFRNNNENQPAALIYECYGSGGRAMGTLFMLSAPLEGWRQVVVTARKTRIDYAHVLKALSDDYFPQADCIVLVQDNLNTHSFSSLYEAFEPAEARRLRERFEAHYTPKHGSGMTPQTGQIKSRVPSFDCCLGQSCLTWRRS